MRAMLALMLTALLSVAACSKASADVAPKAIEQKYGLTGGYVDEISTEDGKVKATIIPTTLDDGRKVQLVIPHQAIGDTRFTCVTGSRSPHSSCPILECQ